jgi:subtilisin family serine protease
MEDLIEFLPIEDMEYEYQFAQLSQTVDWGLNKANVQEFHKITKGSGIKVAVLDTGKPIHTDLPDMLGLDTTGENSPVDSQGHSTHVCGIIGARDNDFGILGVAPEVELMTVKVLGNSGHGGYAGIEAGIRAAIDEGVDVINMSLGAPVEPPASFHQAVIDAVNNGIIIVAAAGNDSGSVNWPARYPEVIAVGAIDENGNLADFSSRGSEVSVVAAGVNIYSTYLNNQYAVLKGTSQASPFVAGICALLLAKDRLENPNAYKITSVQAMLEALDVICDQNGRFNTIGKEGNFGFGIPKFCNAYTQPKV